MKSLLFTGKLLLGVLFILSCIFSGCKEEEKVDPCLSTVAPDKSIIVIVTVRVEDEAGNPLPNKNVIVRFERHPCGASATAVNIYEFNTDQSGQVYAGPDTITLKNTADDAFITATATDLVTSVNFSNRTYHYDEFTNFETKDLLLLIKKEGV